MRLCQILFVAALCLLPASAFADSVGFIANSSVGAELFFTSPFGSMSSQGSPVHTGNSSYAQARLDAIGSSLEATQTSTIDTSGGVTRVHVDGSISGRLAAPLGSLEAEARSNYHLEFDLLDAQSFQLDATTSGVALAGIIGPDGVVIADTSGTLGPGSYVLFASTNVSRFQINNQGVELTSAFDVDLTLSDVGLAPQVVPLPSSAAGGVMLVGVLGAVRWHGSRARRG